jgi:hypothetical protein
MGFGVCGIMGAQLAAPERPCVTALATLIMARQRSCNCPRRLDQEREREGDDACSRWQTGLMCS